MAPHLSQLFQQPKRRPSRRRSPRSPQQTPMGLFLMVYVGLVFLMVRAPFTDALPTTRQVVTVSPNGANTQVEIRSRPGGGRVSGQMQVGDRAEVLDQSQANDGSTWYFVRFSGTRQQGWIRSDQLTVGNVAITTPQASPSRSSQAPLPAQVSSSQPSNPVTRPVNVPTRTAAVSRNASAQEAMDYFLEIALGSEWGNDSGTVRRWTQDLRIQVLGAPTQADLDTLVAVVSELNQLTNGEVSLQFVRDNPNVQVYFVPERDFSRYEPNYVPRNMGFFWTRSNGSGIYNARILISTTDINQTERSHLIREELTQSMGLMRDSYRYDDSIFQQRWTRVTEYSDIDRAVIQLLYRPDIRPGMTRSQVLSQLGRTY